MPGAKKKKTTGTPVEEALLQTAQRLDETWPGMNVEDLGGAAILAILRRHMFDTLHRWGHAPDSLDRDNVEAWWKFAQDAASPLLDSALDPKKLDEPKKACALAILVPGVKDMGQAYQELQEVALARRKNGALYLSKGRSARRTTGMFFTPDWIAGRLAAMALDNVMESYSPKKIMSTLRVLDPACGSGRLLMACLDRLLSRMCVSGRRRAQAARELIPAVVRGVDINPVAAALARSFLWMVADPRLGPLEGLDRVVVVGDALAGPLHAAPKGTAKGAAKRAKGVLNWEKAFKAEMTDGGSGFSVVIGNPPFEVLKGFGKRQGLKNYVERIRKSGYDLALSGNLNTYRLFLERSLELLSPGGRLAFVLPVGFLMDRTAAPLRTHMLKSGWIEQVAVFPESSRVFEDVGQSVVLLAAIKKDRTSSEVAVFDGAGQLPDTRIPADYFAALDPESMPIPVAPDDAYALAARMRENNTTNLGELATGRVGEVDQTTYRRFIKSDPGDALLLRGTHLSPYRASTDKSEPNERWLDSKGFKKARGGGRWKDDMKIPRISQTGIVNMEAGRRLVAAEAPRGVYLGNSVNYWVPKGKDDWDADLLRGYLLGLLNSTPMEWRFRLTSSNNNVNLYEIRSLPLPRLIRRFPQERITSFLKDAMAQVTGSRLSVLSAVRQITTGWGTPHRDDRAVGMLIGQVARHRESEKDEKRAHWLDTVLDHLVNWHLGNDEPDLERMYRDIPARAWEG
jgi:Alw26I/Eco31I/Esp3I family type II restriction m6 adenine DNA methyltransferase